jgi:biopolymer transport protein ExbD
MRAIRRDDLAPRVEMMPLIDVIFLLLTFFIYSLIVTVRAEVLPVTLTTLTTGKQATPTEVQAITIDHDGQLYLNREPITGRDLSTRLISLSDLPDPPSLYVAMEAQGSTDRGPILLDVIERVRAAGIGDFVIVGQPKPGPGVP